MALEPLATKGDESFTFTNSGLRNKSADEFMNCSKNSTILPKIPCTNPRPRRRTEDFAATRSFRSVPPDRRVEKLRGSSARVEGCGGDTSKFVSLIEAVRRHSSRSMSMSSSARRWNISRAQHSSARQRQRVVRALPAVACNCCGHAIHITDGPCVESHRGAERH